MARESIEELKREIASLKATLEAARRNSDQYYRAFAAARLLILRWRVEMKRRSPLAEILDGLVSSLLIVFPEPIVNDKETAPYFISKAMKVYINEARRLGQSIVPTLDKTEGLDQNLPPCLLLDAKMPLCEHMHHVCFEFAMAK